MKTKNNIICCFMAIVLTIVMNSCTDYPDVYGFNVNMSDTEQSLTISPDGYNVTLKTPVYYDEGTGITKYGYIINGNEVPAEFVRTDNHNGYLTATISNLAYGSSYTVLPVIGDDAKQEYGLNVYLNLTKDLFFPQWVSSEMTMNADGEIVLTAIYSCPATGKTYKPVNKATATFGGKEIEATVSEDGTTVNVIIGDGKNLAKGEYSGIAINAANDFGTTQKKFNFYAKVEDISQTYDNDGLKSDHIRLCDIKWAKGNFIVENGNGRILPNQWDVVRGYSQNGNGGYFNPIRDNNSSFFNDFPYIKGYIELKGNYKYDAVTIQLPDWGTPDLDDFDTILKYCSYMECKVKTNDGLLVDGLLFVSPKNSHKRILPIFYKDIIMVVSHENIDRLGLFLPNSGCSANNNLYYLISTVQFEGWKDNSRGFYLCYDWGWNTHYYNFYMDQNYGYYCPIRPVRLQ